MNSSLDHGPRKGGCRVRPIEKLNPLWRWAATGGLVVGALMVLLSGADARGPVMAAIKEIPHEGLYRRTFSLGQDAVVEIEAVGSGWPEEDILFAYAWLLDLRSRQPVWRMDVAHCEKDRYDNVRCREQLDLPAGDYVLYFSALGGSFPIQKKVKLMKILELGTVSILGGGLAEWDRYGRPAQWHVIVQAVADDFPSSAIGPLADLPEPETLVRFERVGSLEYHRARLHVSRKVALRLQALGEYAAREQSFADGAWIEDVDRCRRILEMTLSNTKHAGGAMKNRSFDADVVLPAGDYMVCFASDDSHAFDEWNTQPPYDPDRWGLRLTASEPLPEGAIRVSTDLSDDDLVAGIDGVGDSEFHRVGFTLREPADICIQALGEWGRKEQRFVDFGWIEDALTLELVWRMDNDEGYFAGGEGRNRLINDGIHLAPGSYYLCYVTDGAHSCERWHDHPPFDPQSWGITLRGKGPAFSRAQVQSFGEREGPAALVRIGPLGDRELRRVRFQVAERMAVRLIAQGEGGRGKMYDYGWLVNEDTGETVWKMMYEDTMHGGGAEKNRYARRTLTLDPGRYALHFRTDDSHSFVRWNAPAPYEPHLWGVTLIELL